MCDCMRICVSLALTLSVSLSRCMCVSLGAYVFVSLLSFLNIGHKSQESSLSLLNLSRLLVENSCSNSTVRILVSILFAVSNSRNRRFFVISRCDILVTRIFQKFQYGYIFSEYVLLCVCASPPCCCVIIFNVFVNGCLNTIYFIKCTLFI